MLIEQELTQQVIAAAIEVHRALGPGLLEAAYEACLLHELRLGGIEALPQVSLPITYKGIQLDCGYRVDLLIPDRLIIELKAVERLTAIHEAQLQSYLRMSGIRVGLLINFNVMVLKDGIVRRVV